MCLNTSHFRSIELSLVLIAPAFLEHANLGAITPKGEIHHQVPDEYQGYGTQERLDPLGMVANHY